VDLYPAIDVRGGRAVRLYQGDYSRETVYGADPVAVARSFAGAGARWIHVVDLDAARSGVAENGAVVAAIAGAVHPSVAVQSGGGVRSADAADALMSAGVARVVLGTAALESPDLVAELASRMPVAIGLDVRGREVAIRGWTEGSGADVLDVVRRFEDIGVEAVIVTQIARDGTLSGPDVDGLSAVLEATSLAVIASGGVGSLADLETLGSLSAAGRSLAGVIVGKALYAGGFSVEEALAAVATRF
jgi:phosphoribosylformimino-5-aminoimidazole carboxamide ribotide isomerase